MKVEEEIEKKKREENFVGSHGKVTDGWSFHLFCLILITT